ncbi:hypothetical protein SmJEL517_g03112 [Synchytrium microbalum]|uniref:Autophagy-related protein 2 n=1 Tax=Synchytrium microbalum TaxID=1806994 RepID=A0A507C7Y6_9FUNG|nr:uncharacterized protein SmJEL517_g03112 [Synchytrium microbalum]TPX34144.1 hypothetical protein SmJEL517_g03112 [Synchytrium microbalum]
MSLLARAVHFLLKRAIGQFLLKEIDLSDLDVQIGNGHVALRNLELNVDVLNELASNLPFVITEGRVSLISATVPWNNLWSGHCSVELDGLHVVVKPTTQEPPHQTVRSPVDDSPAIMSSSLHFADDFLHHEVVDDAELDQAFKPRKQTSSDVRSAAPPPRVGSVTSTVESDSSDGLHAVAGFMDAILSRVVVTVKNAMIRVVFRSSSSLAPPSTSATNDYHLDVCLTQASYGGARADDTVTGVLDKVVRLGQASISLNQLQEPAITKRQSPTESEDVFDMEGVNNSPSAPSDNTVYSYQSVIMMIGSDVNSTSTWMHFASKSPNDSGASLYASASEHAPAKSSISSTHPKYDLACYIPGVCSLLFPCHFPVITELASVIIDSTRQSALNGDSQNASNAASPSPSSPPDTTSRYRSSGPSSYSSPRDRVVPPGAWTSHRSSYDDVWGDDPAPNLLDGSYLTGHGGDGMYTPVYDALVRVGLYIRKVGIFIVLNTDSFSEADVKSFYKSFAESCGTLKPDVDLTTLDLTSLTGLSGEKYFADKGISPDAVGASLKAGHLKLEISSVLVQGQQETDAFFSSRYQETARRLILELAVDTGAVCEWITDRNIDSESQRSVATPAFDAYNDIVSFDLYSDPSRIPTMLAQLNHKYQPGATEFARWPSRHRLSQPTHSLRSLKDTSRPQRAIFASFEQSIPLPETPNSGRRRRHTPPQMSMASPVMSNHLLNQDLKIELGVVHLNLDLRLLDRVSPLLKKLKIPKKPVVSPSQPLSRAQNQFQSDFMQRDTVGSIIQDLEQRDVKDGSNVVKTNFTLKMPLVRIWLASPDMRHVYKPALRARADRECHIRPHMLVLDLIDLHASTSMSTRKSTGDGARLNSDRRQSEIGREASTDAKAQLWELKLREIGLSLAKNAAARLPGDSKYSFERVVSVKPILHIGSNLQARTTEPSQMDSSQNVLVKLYVQDVSLSSAFEQHSVSSAIGEGFPRVNEETEEDSGWGLRSWYDLGSSRKAQQPDASLYGHRDMDDELMWFKQRAIRESRVFLNCQLPPLAITLPKADFDIIQLLANELTLWQPQTIQSFEFNIPSDDDDTSTNQQSETTYATADDDFSNPGKFSYAKRPTDFTAEVMFESITVTIHPERVALDRPECCAYELYLQSLSAFIVQGYDGKPTTHGWLDVDEVSMTCIDPFDDVPTRKVLFRRTLPPTVKLHQTSSMLVSSFVIHSDKDLNHKDMSANIEISRFTAWAPLDPSVALDIMAFVKEAPELIFVDIPTRSTALSLVLGDFCITHDTLDAPHKVVSVTDNLKISTKLMPPGFPTQTIKVVMHNSSVYLLYDDSTSAAESAEYLLAKAVDAASLGGYTNIRKYWTTLGYVDVAAIDFLDVLVRKNEQDMLPKVEVEVTDHQVTIDLCADSVSTLVELFQIIGEKLASHKQVQPETPEEPQEDVPDNDTMANVDQDAFRQTQPRTSDYDNVIVMDDFFGDDLLEEDDEDIVSPVHNPRTNTASRARPGVSGAGSEDIIRCLDEPESFKFIENHFDMMMSLRDQETQTKKQVDPIQTRIVVSDFDICLRIHDGFDWPVVRAYVAEQEEIEKKRRREWRKGKSRSSTRPPEGGQSTESLESATDMDDDNHTAPSEYNPPPSSRSTSRPKSAGTYTPMGDSMFDDSDSVHSGTTSGRQHAHSANAAGHAASSSAAGNDANRSTRIQSLARSESRLDCRLVSVRFEYDTYPETLQKSFRGVLTIRDFEIIDNVRTSRWRKFLSRLRGEGADQWSSSVNMLRVDVMGVRSGGKKSEEFRLRVRVLPMRLFVDQDALTCLIRFATFASPIKRPSNGASKPDTTFFQLVDIQPISFKIDYKPKHLDYSNIIRDGKVIEFMNLFHFDSADITLRAVRLTGIRGAERLVERLISEWLPHVRNTQVPRMMSGLSTVRPIVNLGNGIADLVLLPIEQFRKDGRIIRGLQRGAKSFAKAATLESINLGARLAVGTQVLLEAADDVLSFEATGEEGEEGDILYSFDDDGGSSTSIGTSGSSNSVSGASATPSKFSDQPRNVREGVESAYRSLRRNFGDAARTILAIPTEIQENPGAQGTAAAVIRAVPVLVLKPMIGTTEAVSKTLLGLRNQIDPSKHQESESKYKN